METIFAFGDAFGHGKKKSFKVNFVFYIASKAERTTRHAPMGSTGKMSNERKRTMQFDDFDIRQRKPKDRLGHKPYRKRIF